MVQKDKLVSDNFNKDELGHIVEPLLLWYQDHARDLPWRKDINAYRVWVSEIMLQQTRVEAVIQYYVRFMNRLPDIHSLAVIEEEELLKLWEGLGYYSRVKNMQKAARVIEQEYHGHFPEDYENILQLPGIGPYTAGAISSIAYGNPRAAVDGNVFRVITRLTEDNTDITDPKFRKHLEAQLGLIYPVGSCSAFTQSLMELGATVCVPNGAPKCKECPLQMQCKAYTHQTQLKFPVKKEKKARKIQEKTVLILECDQKTAVRKREENGLLAGLWEFPNIEGKLEVQQVLEWVQQNGIVIDGMSRIIKEKDKKHIFTHIEWHMNCYTVQCRVESMKAAPSDWVWVTKEELHTTIALPTAFRKLLPIVDQY